LADKPLNKVIGKTLPVKEVREKTNEKGGIAAYNLQDASLKAKIEEISLEGLIDRGNWRNFPS
jgi:hypothetical protein